MHSIVVLVYNSPAYSVRCLESILANIDADDELIAVDNGSGEETVRLLDELRDRPATAGRLTVIRNETNVGCSTGRNQGVDAARGEDIAFLDNDTIVTDPSWLGTLRDAIDRWPGAGMAGPKLVYPGEPRRIQFAGGGVSPTGRIAFLGRGRAADDPAFNERREVQFFITACLMVRHDVLDDVGGFDEAFNPVQFEDIDLCYRARERGYKAIYVPEVEITHCESVTTAASGKLNNAYIVTKHGMLFKKRWRHMFEGEGGPSDEQIGRWEGIAGSVGFPGGERST